MVDLILTHPSKGPSMLFTRNFRVHSGIPIGLYEEGPRSPVAIIYGDVSAEVLRETSEYYDAIIAIPSMEHDSVPENPCHYETMTVKAPILATIQNLNRGGFTDFVKTFEGGPLVLLGHTGKVLTLLFTADLVKATIRILSGEMERETGTDSFGRPNPLPESITCAPAVSLHFNLIENAIRYVYKKLGLPLLSIPRWPESAPLTIFLSHDVDVVRKWTPKRTVYELSLGIKDMIHMKGKRIYDTVCSIIEAMKGRDPYWMFEKLLIMEKGNGFKSTWFFAPFGDEFNKRENMIDPVYRRSTAEITAMIRRILDNGCELALHGTRRSFFDSEALKRQQESFENRLGFKLQGVRHHYLMFRHGATLEALSKIGMLYDTTLGFSDRPGYRNGMASPFFPFPIDHPAGKIVEIPLNLMDSVFILANESEEAIKRRATESYLYAKAAGGLFSVLVHPSNMDQMEIPGLENFYHSLLSRFRLDHVYSMTGSELMHWWNAREEVLKTLEYDSEMWRIGGVDFPDKMDILIAAPNIKSMRFTIEGTSGASDIKHDTLTIRPGSIDPDTGISIVKKK